MGNFWNEPNWHAHGLPTLEELRAWNTWKDRLRAMSETQSEDFNRQQQIEFVAGSKPKPPGLIDRS